MTMARIEIEQVERDRWVAEIEAGFPRCRRARIMAPDYLGALAAVTTEYERLVGVTLELGAPMPIKPAPRPMPAHFIVQRVTADQVKRARAIGVRADLRWSQKRLRRELEKVAAEVPA